MSNFDRLKTKEGSEKQKGLTNAPELNKQIETGVKSVGLDAMHDAKLIQLKYLTNGGKIFISDDIRRFDFTKQTNVEMKNGKPKTEKVTDKTTGMVTEKIVTDGNPGVKEFLQPFVDIKNVFGPGFLDHALYDYNIPYPQLEEFSKNLASINEALKQGLMRLTEEEERSLLNELQMGNDVDKLKFLETQKAETLDVSETLSSKEAGPALEQQKTYVNMLMNKNMLFLEKEFRGDDRMDADAAHNVVMGLTAYTGELITTEMNQLEATKKDGLTTLDLHAAMNTVTTHLQLSPFMQGLKTTTVCKDVGEQDCNFDKFGDLKEFRTPDLTLQFLKSTGLDPKKIVFHKKNNEINQEKTGTTIIASFKQLGDKLSKLKNPTSTDIMAAQGEVLLNQSLDWLEKGANYITTKIDELKASGARDKIEKIRNLLFGTDDFLVCLSKFNEMKESKLGVEKTAAVQAGTNLMNEGTDGLDDLDNKRTQNKKTGPLDDNEKEAVHLKIGATLFNPNYLVEDRNVSPWCAQLKTALGEETYTKMVGAGNDLYDLMAKNMLTPENYTSYLTYRTASDGESAVLLLENGGVKKFVDEITKEHPNITSHELYAKTLLARMLGTKENAAGVVKATTNETQQGIDVARVELDSLTKNMNIRVEESKLFLDGVPTTDKVGIKIASEMEPVEYNHTNGIALNTLGAPPKFTVVKKQTDEKWSDLVRTGDLSVVLPANVDVGQDTKMVTVKGLEAGDYSLQTDYEKDTTKKSTVDTSKNVAVNNNPLTHIFATDAGKPTALRLKPKTGGLRQTVWKSA